jgi:ribosomal protein RSM22 (predicted rRNA methylase)
LRVLQEVAQLLPGFSPSSLRDAGAGPGTASWAALATWPGLASIIQVEHSAAFRALAAHLNGASGIAALARAEVRAGDVRDGGPGPQTDLTIASYVLAELPLEEVGRLSLGLWQGTGSALVLIEPGTPAGFSRTRLAREALLRNGAFLAGPCTHDAACPITGDDWCHFKERVQRSRTHMHAKGASVPFEDEPYCWLAVSRTPVQRGSARVIGPAVHGEAGISFRLCANGSIARRNVASRDKATYKRLRKLEWGDALPGDET